MEAASRAPDTLVINQDEDSEIRIQPVIQGGVRRLDVRVWRRGPAGLAPSRDALTVDHPDLGALGQGIAELLEASGGGEQVARIVLDTGDGRRLRAETEPFGTRHVAHLGFWQRARNTWRPDGDGIVLAAGCLPSVQEALHRLGDELFIEEGAEDVDMPPADLPWPNPGADWLTVEPARVAFHPRGVRITGTVEERDGKHSLEVRQWRREDSIWLPEQTGIELTAVDLDGLLTCLHVMAAGSSSDQEIACADGSALRLKRIGEEPLLQIERRTGEEGPYEPRLELPIEYLPRFGRALTQSWALLLRALTQDERDNLQGLDLSEPAGMTEELPVVPSQSGHPPRAIGPAVRFGEESETPGAVIPQEGQVRIVVEGYLIPRGLTLPSDVVARVVSGLEELYALQRSQPRIAPMLVCDRPDCAVYGRVGTTTRPNSVEIRAWTSPRDSESITFERIYLRELIDALRQALRALDEPEPAPTVAFQAAENLERQAEPATVEPAVEEPIEPEPEPIHLSSLDIGGQFLRLDLHDSDQSRILTLQSAGRSLQLAVDHLEELLSDIRALYYDAFRGKRGHMTVGEPPIEIGIRTIGTQMCLDLRQERDGETACLSFPAEEIPAFLDAVRGAFAEP